MTITCNKKGVWNIDDVHKKVLSDYYFYSGERDPGTLWMWGYDGNGQLGQGSAAITRSSPVQIPGDQWIEYKQTRFATLARKSDNTLWAWGYGTCGDLGISSNPASQASPAQVPGTAWCSLGSGMYYGLGIKTDNTLWAWGKNDAGQLGQNNIINRNSPVQIPGTQWQSAASTTNSPSAFAIKNDGTLWAWGADSTNTYFLGLNTSNIPRSSPVQIPGNQWIEVQGSLARNFARKTDGTLWVWGCNTQGAIGDGTVIFRSSPVQIPGAWTAASFGTDSSAALKSDGTLWMWGINGYGQLGQNNFIHRSSPVQVPGTQWTSVDLGSRTTLARKIDGTLWGWGCNTNSYALIGNNTNINYSSPVQIPGTNWIDPSTNWYNSIARKSCTPAPPYDVIGTQLWGWGRNDKGRLGTNDQIHRCSPVNIPGGAWCQIKAGAGISLGLKTDNTLWSWGYGASVGGLGQGAVDCLSSPVQIPGTAWCRVEVGRYTSLALKTDNTLWIWGSGSYGGLGDNTRIPKSSPIQLPGTSWCDISASVAFNSTAAIKTDNTLWSWGYNSQGQLGDSTVIHRSSPVQVPGTAWCDVSLGHRHMSALKTDGTLWAAGFNLVGVIGDGTTIPRCSPIQVPGTAWCKVEAGYTTLALKTDSTLWSWGNRYFGAIGDNATIYRSSPVQIPGTQWVQIANPGNQRSNFARKSDNTLWAWGRNHYGQLGQGDTIHRSSPTQIPGTCWLNIGGSYSAAFAIKCFTG
jgi:alpha-tubulin suppressor-like RCC1 family protein